MRGYRRISLRTALTALAALALSLLLASCSGRQGGHNGQADIGDGHDHAAHVGEAHQDQARAVDGGHDEAMPSDAEDDAEHFREGERIELTPQQRERIGLEIATVGPGNIAMGGSFPGEVVLNPDRMAHVVPQTAGIVRDVGKTIGDRVGRGEVLAWIESDRLAEAKLNFYDKHAELGCCQIEVPRATAIFENTTKLLTHLAEQPTEQDLRQFDGLEMGKYHAQLVAAYSDYVTAQKTYDRERALRDKGLASEKDVVAAESALNRARAGFHTAKDSALYEVRVAYSEAVRKRQVAEFEASAAEQRLRLLGASDHAVEALRALVPTAASLQPCTCDDPNCEEGDTPSVLDALRNDRRLGWYALKAPFSGIVTEKHLTRGEKVDDAESVFTIADTSTVWVHFSVYQKDLGAVRRGQSVRIKVGEGVGTRSGTIDYVAPVVDRETRTASARVVVGNEDGSLRPGLYATVEVAVQNARAPVLVPKSAVQVLHEEDVIFVEDGDGFVAVPVTLGRADSEHVEVTAGLSPGQRYATRGAFELKAQIVASGLDPHAGHGH